MGHEMKFPRLGPGVMPAKKKGSKRQPQQRENTPWPKLDWTETAEYRRNLDETRRANLCEGRYERMLIAQAEFSAARARDAETSPRRLELIAREKPVKNQHGD